MNIFGEFKYNLNAKSLKKNDENIKSTSKEYQAEIDNNTNKEVFGELVIKN